MSHTVITEFPLSMVRSTSVVMDWVLERSSGHASRPGPPGSAATDVLEDWVVALYPPMMERAPGDLPPQPAEWEERLSRRTKTEFLDSMCDQSEAGLTVLKGEHSYSINANFKYLCENSYDGYHLLPVHVSYLEFLDDRLKASGADSAVNFIANLYKKQGRGRGLGNGHGALESWVPTGRPVASWIPPWGPEVKKEIDAKRSWLEGRYGKEKSDFISDVQKNLVIFPNLVINDNVGMIIRTIEPTSASSMRVASWALGLPDESEALRAIRLDNFVSFLGPAGFGSADDIEMLELCQRGIEHTPVEWNELSKGMNGAEDSRVEVCGPADEGQMRAYWAQWDRMIRGLEPLEA